jgi:uncharacterized protein
MLERPARADELETIVLGCEWLRELLTVVAALEAPDCWIGAGAVRDLVWDIRFGSGFDPGHIKDVDVVFFDAGDLTAEREHEYERVLKARDGTVEWDVKNQARVHLWYEARFGTPAEPLVSASDGIATWPETATAVGCRMRADGRLDVAAPLGLDDLLDGVWRRNPARVSDREWQARLVRKRPAERWPGVTVV